ncbi:MAG TPA: hypothetical protein PK674_01705 [Candidatus Absconditabacterales bacterium]|jgi:hypothetical protein|uniref:Uncharacterized protein n=1 Tax=candidate division CPR1 bacterium ADurb.Bin160 TaxID=1852826 RepID=A0A1V5ZMC3_9BACT|nr:MAG: hypothetical protein BWY04_00940 [candidate division CPR1 bacterium ADurb.Bin160]HOG15280.1 hypothetical protein [Candidatus Absconditabacterales bacterium]HOQ79013.1 hypothetical protein [Candidatus Absconditabacterales bacterium]HPK28096.1 hypothetical protein [Candidatus Absconditabacterales bacterium]
MAKKTKKKLRAYIGASIIIIGFMVFTAGKPNPINPKIIDPTWQTMLLGTIMMFLGYKIGQRAFPALLEDEEDLN